MINNILTLPSREEIEAEIFKNGLMNVVTYESIIEKLQEQIYNLFLAAVQRQPNNFDSTDFEVGEPILIPISNNERPIRIIYEGNFIDEE